MAGASEVPLVPLALPTEVVNSPPSHELTSPQGESIGSVFPNVLLPRGFGAGANSDFSGGEKGQANPSPGGPEPIPPGWHAKVTPPENCARPENETPGSKRSYAARRFPPGAGLGRLDTNSPQYLSHGKQREVHPVQGEQSSENGPNHEDGGLNQIMEMTNQIPHESNLVLELEGDELEPPLLLANHQSQSSSNQDQSESQLGLLEDESSNGGNQSLGVKSGAGAQTPEEVLAQMAEKHAKASSQMVQWEPDPGVDPQEGGMTPRDQSPAYPSKEFDENNTHYRLGLGTTSGMDLDSRYACAVALPGLTQAELESPLELETSEIREFIPLPPPWVYGGKGGGSWTLRPGGRGRKGGVPRFGKPVYYPPKPPQASPG